MNLNLNYDWFLGSLKLHYTKSIFFFFFNFEMNSLFKKIKTNNQNPKSYIYTKSNTPPPKKKKTSQTNEKRNNTHKKNTKKTTYAASQALMVFQDHIL